MPGSGPHRFHFVDKEPLIFRVVVLLLVVGGFLRLALDFGAKYFLPKATATLQACEALTDGGIQYHAPAVVCSYADNWIWLDFSLLGAGALIMLIFRKRVRYTYRGR